MTTPFENMPAHAKVWVYASDKILTPTQVNLIQEKAVPFIQSWTAHSNQLKATFAILHNCFLVFMVDESFNEISGCGIDKSVHLVKEIEAETGLNLFNRLAIQVLDNDELTVYRKSNLLESIHQNLVSPLAKTFNNQVSTKQEFDTNWIIPIEKAWFYPKQNILQN
ncbi:MAG: hypothetical protein V4620_12625 [Bacteroidota bacterium]